MVHEITFITSSPGHTDRRGRQLQILPALMWLSTSESKGAALKAPRQMNSGIYHGMLSGLGPFQEYMPKGKPEANSNPISHLRKSVLPQASSVNHTLTPYAFPLISLGPSQKHTAINTFHSKGTKNSVNNPYGKLLCLKHQLINSQKHRQCFKTNTAFTPHTWESWTMELNWFFHGHQGKSMLE